MGNYALVKNKYVDLLSWKIVHSVWTAKKNIKHYVKYPTFVQKKEMK